MLKALSQFMVMLTSSNQNSTITGAMKQAVPSLLTSSWKFFNTKCASCHATDLMTDDSFRNNGLAINPLINDVGRYRVTRTRLLHLKCLVCEMWRCLPLYA
jgi:cytochrome c peroxidase